MDARMREEKKQRLKKRLRKMSPERRKELLEHVKLRRADKAALEAETTTENGQHAQAQDELSRNEVLTDEQIIESLFDSGSRTSADEQRLIRGLKLLDIWHGLRALATFVVPMSKQVDQLYKVGISRVASTADAPNELAPINARKLYEFIHTIPGVWDNRFNCEDALCWQCPWHRGKGVANQNLECAEEATKIAIRRNRRIDLAEGIPYKKVDLEKLPRRSLVALTKIVGKDAFHLKDSTKAGLVRVILANQRKFKGLPAGDRERVKIMDLTGKEVTDETTEGQE